MNEKRIHGEKLSLVEADVLSFFEQRGQIDSSHDYVSVMYQDKQPELADKRDRYEKEIILPKLQLCAHNYVLDIGCGVGRWADVLLNHIKAYVGVDFSKALIDKAKARINQPNFSFHVRKAQDIDDDLRLDCQAFDVVIISGVLVYLNDNQVKQLFERLARLIKHGSRLYLREPLAVVERLTLNGFWSDELKQPYYAIYRTQHELNELIQTGLKRQRPVMFEPLYANGQLNNRQETKQFYTVIEF